MSSPQATVQQTSSSASEATTLHETTPERVLQRLEWRVIRRLDGLLQGDYRTLFYGTGIDFADLREYQPHDDIRHIDWNVTARMDSPHVRQYVEDREITAWFLLDLSESMHFGPANRPKDSVLVDFVATLARLLTRDGNRVGSILYRSQVEQTIPPRGGRNQVLRLIRELLPISDRSKPGFLSAQDPNVPQPSFWQNLLDKFRGQGATKADDSSVKGRATDLSHLLNAGLNTFRRRSLVFVISDFISEPGWESALSLLAQRHELIAIRLWDPREAELPDAGQIVVEDAETGEYLTVDTSSPAFRQRFQAAAQAREEALAASMKRAGVELYAISNDDEVTDAIVRMVSLRKRRR